MSVYRNKSVLLGDLYVIKSSVLLRVDCPVWTGWSLNGVYQIHLGCNNFMVFGTCGLREAKNLEKELMFFNIIII